jgi:hypothetical protein
MKPSIIKRTPTVSPLHPWERATIAASLHRRATVRLRAGVALLAASCGPFFMNAGLWLIEAAVCVLLVSAWLIGRALILASRACKL